MRDTIIQIHCCKRMRYLAEPVCKVQADRVDCTDIAIDSTVLNDCHRSIGRERRGTDPSVNDRGSYSVRRYDLFGLGHTEPNMLGIEDPFDEEHPETFKSSLRCRWEETKRGS
ncbi:MAG: hypothetical protein AAF526_02310 [Pseudomonadota bacterium]